jgi:hypothetical protein
VVSDLSGAWNLPELRPQSRAKADLGTYGAPGFPIDTAVACLQGGPLLPAGRAVPLRLGPYLQSIASLAPKPRRALDR